MDELTEFTKILSEMLCTNSEIRQKSEKCFENIPAKNKVHLLFLTISNDTQLEEIRQLATVLIRQVLFKSFDDFLTDPNYIEQFRSSILALIQKENLSSSLRKKICDIITELCLKFIDDEGNNKWTEILNFMFNAANSTSLELKECSLLIINSCPNIFGNQQSKYLDFIKKMLLKCLCEDSNNQVKLAALKATSSFILFNNDDKVIVKLMSDTVLPMLQITDSLLENQDDQPLLQLIELSEKCPQILRPNLNVLMDICVKIISDRDKYSEELRHSAIEIVVSFAENAAGSFRKRCISYLEQLVTQLLFMMTDLEDDDDWSVKNKDENDDSTSDHIIGETALDRLACALGGKIVYPIAIAIISQMLLNSDWKKRYAALTAISALGEGCHKQMSPVLDQIIIAVLQHVRDPHPRVRYAVCVALGQMASDFAPIFQERYHDKFIPNLLLLLDDEQNPRVQAHASAAFVNFFEESKQKIIINYVPAIVEKFEQVLQSKIHELFKNGSRLVLERILISIASLSDLIQESFINYYDKFMPFLKLIIENANHKELRLLRGKAIECVSLIGLSVGSEKFLNDAPQIMNMLLQTQTGEIVLEDDDPQLSYLITSWVRICKLLGPKFEPYLPMVMPQVLKTASMKVEMALIEGDVEKHENSGDWKYFNISEEQNFGIKVSVLDDKATACEMLVCYARELKHGFVNYLEDTVQILVPLLKFYFHEDIRTAAAQSLPYLLECAKIRGENYVYEMWNYVWPQLLSALEKESENEVLAEMLLSLSDCISTLGINSLNDHQMESLINYLNTHLNEHFERSKERQEQRNDEDYDDGVEETLNDEDEDDIFILTKLVDVLHSLFVIYGQKFLPCFNHLFKHVVNLAASTQPVSHQQLSICIMDDVIEFCGEKCVDYKDFFLPLLRTNLQSPHAELRQSATYGLGILAKHGGESFAQVLSETIPALVLLIQSPNSRSDENIFATENAISAVTKIIEFNHSQLVGIDELLSFWVSWLPIFEDEEETIYVYNFLYQLLERNHPSIIGRDNCNVPHIVSGILEVFARNVIEPSSELGQKLISYVKFVNLDANIISKFSIPKQQAFEEIIKL